MKRLGIVLLCCALCSTLGIRAEAARMQPDFSLSCETMEHALELEAASQAMGTPQDALRLLAFAAANTDGTPDSSDVSAAWRTLAGGVILKDALGEHYRRFLSYEALYRAALGGISDAAHGAFFPVADGYFYTHSGDFAAPNRCGRRCHGGHDIFGTYGTPVVAAEGGIVEAADEGHITIRSDDGLRRYRYANLCSVPAAAGERIEAGAVLGTMDGEPAFVHLTLEVIPQSGQTVVIDPYEITRLLRSRRSAVIWDTAEARWMRIGAHTDA